MDISSMLEVEVQEVADSKENVIPSLQLHQRYPCINFSDEENEFYKLTYGSDVASVRFLKLHCTGCNVHIGSAPNEGHNMHEHPVLRVLLCAKCREFYGTGTFEQGDDATDMYCRWCANGGNLYCCSYCSNTFCSACIERNFDPPTIKRIEEEDSWKCFVCDPKDLYPLRSICRALLLHVETVTRLLENTKNMSSSEVEEKKHLDETKCCSRKRKRRRRRTSSLSDDEEEDTSYVPEVERAETPPAKRRRYRCSTVRNVLSNGYDHEYSHRSEKSNNSDVDPSDLMMSCEQSMVEGDTEILNTEDSAPEAVKSPPRVVPNVMRSMQFKKIAPNNKMAINPVPLANLLKVAISSGAKQIKIGGVNKKLVAVPMSMVPKSVVASSISFVKPATHFLVPKTTMKPVVQQVVRVTNQQPQQQQQQQQKKQKQSPSVIDLDSDDEPVILDGEVNNGVVSDENVIITDQIEEIEETVIEGDTSDNDSNSTQPSNKINDDELQVITEKSQKSTSTAPPQITVDGTIPLKIQQRDQRFKKMLVIQSQEIDSTIGDLKTKVLKLVQLSNSRPHQDENLLNSAAVCTKRFHRAMRKALVELSQINDRLVRDYVHWRKRSIKTGVKKRSQPKEDIPLEMICVRESASESDDDDDDDDFESLQEENRVIEGDPDLPPEFATILDHLTIFKRKPTAVKAIGGNSSIWTEDKACQADDVPWRDYEKCIGYSLLTRSDYDPETKQEILRPVVTPDENFGKYQEQFLFYLQHIEDNGIETDDSKGLADPNQIPLKDLIDGTSPFITDMLERLSPVTLSNGGNFEDSDSNAVNIADHTEMDVCIEETEIPEEPEKRTEATAAPTSSAVEELVKMVTKLNEDINEQQLIGDKKNNEVQPLAEEELEQETRDAVNSILDVLDKSNEEEQKMDVSISNDDCTTID